MVDRQRLFDVMPRTTLERLPGYLNFLRQKTDSERVSSAVIAESMNLSAITVRKDLAYISSGRPRVGHLREELIERITQVLSDNDCSRAVLVGAGNLGRALMSYGGFGKYGLEIAAGFDNNPALVGGSVQGKPILHIDAMSDFITQNGARMGIITVPAEHAQSVCDRMVEAGVAGILCCAPAHLTVPPQVTVRYEDFAVSLALLSIGMRQNREEQDE